MLEVSGLSADYGSFRALFEVSLAVEAGETVAVIGPNGAGKTTLMRVISGMLAAHSGELAFEGRPITGLSAHRIVELGIAHVPENRRLFPRLTVEENLRMGAYLPAARAFFAERLGWAYEHFPRLRERRSQLAGTLSGGEQ
ncbi:MAG TPA: ATP-binding cassette domain-containing protein, partial [Stellaceae bacterium]|nr:ATP-binding cassette domain-containing protein [Stellaceae bacterium]